MKAIIDGKVVEAKHIEIIEDDGKSDISISQFHVGWQGSVGNPIVLRRKIETCNVSFTRDKSRPIISRKIDWVWYDGLRWSVQCNTGLKPAIYLPGPVALLEWRRVNREEIATAQRVYGWNGHD